MADWSRVTVEHVRQACHMFDSGAVVPKRPTRRTFLAFQGKNYPAKFIRGLAYRQATGVELDPNRDYSGGDETVRFFAGLGLTTRADAGRGKPAAAVPAPTPPTPTSPQPAVSPRRLDPQKQALADLLIHRFGTVEFETRFPWLIVPPREEMDAEIARIFDALQAMRGYTEFAAVGRSLRCDFYIPAERLVIEYDERQHFTLSRARALELYPPDLTIGFDRQEWIAVCQANRATDAIPPYRDEQRAYYDSLRDILAARNHVRLIRLRAGSFDWTAGGGEKQLAELFPAKSAPTPAISESARPAVGLTDAVTICKLALVSHDYSVPGGEVPRGGANQNGSEMVKPVVKSRPVFPV